MANRMECFGIQARGRQCNVSGLWEGMGNGMEWFGVRGGDMTIKWFWLEGTAGKWKGFGVIWDGMGNKMICVEARGSQRKASG